MIIKHVTAEVSVLSPQDFSNNNLCTWRFTFHICLRWINDFGAVEMVSVNSRQQNGKFSIILMELMEWMSLRLGRESKIPNLTENVSSILSHLEYCFSYFFEINLENDFEKIYFCNITNVSDILIVIWVCACCLQFVLYIGKMNTLLVIFEKLKQFLKEKGWLEIMNWLFSFFNQANELEIITFFFSL